MKRNLIHALLASACLGLASAVTATEFHVAITGSDAGPGTQAAPLRTIQRAAELAQPGDTVTVHAGVYRERVNPPRGGESDAKRIVYQAAAGEKVATTGSWAVRARQPWPSSRWASASDQASCRSVLSPLERLRSR